MGNVIERHCPNCTYKKVFQEGAGMNGCNLRIIRKFFEEEEAKDFYSALEQKEIQRFVLAQQTGYCVHCKDYMTEMVLSYTLRDGREKKVRKNCPECKSILSYDEQKKTCPRCGALLQEQMVGLWD